MSEIQQQEAAEKIKQFIYNNFPRARQNAVDVHDPLIASGAVESLGLLTIVDYLETEFDLSVSDTDMTEENFGTIASIAQYVNCVNGPR